MSAGDANQSGRGGEFVGFPLGQSDPQTMGPFRVRARLGSGGMGVVYLAVGVRQEMVALKVIHTVHADQSEFRARFTREVKAMQTVHGPFTTGVVAANLIGNPQWVAMEYVPGRTLADAVHDRGPLAIRQVELLALGLAEALAQIHAAGVVHRDLKPSNVILAADGPRVIDFGIADLADGTSITGTGARIGSMAWMSPEQLRAEDATSAADVHAWAQLICYAATGAGAFGGGTPTAIAMNIIAQKVSLDALPAGLEKLRPILESSLTQNPEERPTAAELVDEIGSRLDPGTALAASLSDVTRLVQREWSPPPVPTLRLPPPRATVDNHPPTVSGQPATSPTSRLQPTVLWAAAVVIVLAVVAAGLALFNPWQSRDPAAIPTSPSVGSTTTPATGTAPVNFPLGNSLWRVNNNSSEPDESVVLATHTGDVVCYQYLGPGDGDTFYGRSETTDSEVTLTGAIVENFSRPAKFAVAGAQDHLQLSEVHPSGSRGTPSDWQAISEQDALEMQKNIPATQVIKQLTQQMDALSFECSRPEPSSS